MDFDPVTVTIGVMALGGLVGIASAIIHDYIEDKQYKKYLAEHVQKYGRLPMNTRTR